MIQKSGLHKLEHDERDFNLGGVYGFIDILEVPNEDFDVSNLFSGTIKDQGYESDLCTAYTTTSVSEDQEWIELSPEFQFFVTKLLSGNPEEWGANLRTACNSLVKYGSLPVEAYSNMTGKSREFILNSKNWDDNAFFNASFYKKGSFFTVKGRYDTFDNIRCALWQHKKDRSTIATGALWRNDWIYAENGIIPSVYGEEGFGHAFKLRGQKIINGEPYIVAQLSNGDKVGDKGLFYFSRDVVNKEIGPYGLFMFKDISKEEVEYYLNSKYTKQTPKYKVIFDILIKFFSSII